MKKRKILLFALGFAMVTFSSIASFVLIDQVMQDASDKEQKIKQLENNIDLIWKDDQINRLFAQNTVLSAANNKKIIDNELVKELYGKNEINLNEIVQKTIESKEKTVEQIQSYYINILSIRDEIDLLNSEKNRLMIISLLLNSLGLIVIIFAEEIAR